jgi:hypothetical protein
MTSTMYMWWIISHLSGILPPVTEFEGNVSGEGRESEAREEGGSLEEAGD